jgi:hypothetical protein
MTRRDEIKFTDWDGKEMTSCHYTLTDFSSAVNDGAQQDFLSNYFYKRYGAIRHIDFSSALEEFTATE